MAQRATSRVHTSFGPKPTLCFCFDCIFLCFPFFGSNRKVTLKRAFLFICLCLPLFLCSLFWPLPFSLSPSLSVSCSFTSSFLSVSHVNFWFLLFDFVLFVFCFKMFFYSCFYACCLVLF